MSDEKMSRRGFLSWALAGVSFLALSIVGCGKKEEAPVEKTPEMTEEQKKEYVFSNCICKGCPIMSNAMKKQVIAWSEKANA